MLTTFLSALVIVFLAEIGDKSLLLAMAFGARNRLLPVLLGIVTAATLSVGLSVAVGDLLRQLFPENVITFGAAALFVVIGTILLLRPEDPEAPDITRTHRRFFAVYGAVVAAFFLAELGDKTMFVVITLAAGQNLIAVYAGAVAGMVSASSLGAVFAYRVARYVKPHVVSRVAGAVFILVGIVLGFGGFGVLS